jgi:hypothetical protein
MVVRDELNAVPKGELCYFHSSPSSALPIRDGVNP